MGIHIELANPNRSYFAGQVVEGRVVVQNAKPDKVKQIVLLLEGVGRVSWSEQETYTVYTTRNVNGQMQTRPETRTRTVTYSAEETYVSYFSSLFGDGQNSTAIPQGIMTYPFRFVLPNNIPSSFSSHVGQVSYYVKGEIKRSLFKFNDRTRLPFTVNGIFDLNLQAGSCIPQETRKDKGSNCCACRTGNLGFVLSLPNRSGFVPGESIDFRAEITNRSNKKVTSVKASLIQITNFYAQGRSKTVTKLIGDIRGPAVEEGEYDVWESHLNIPAVPPSRLGGFCHIINLEYYLNLEMKISGLSSSLVGSLPVMIGTIPLRFTFGNFRQIENAIPAMPIMPSPSGEPTPSKSNHDDDGKPMNPPAYEDVAPSAPIFADYPDLPPPTYEQAVGTEGFTWNPAEGSEPDQNGHAQNYQGTNTNGNDPNVASPSAPSIDEFVPNYITYNRRV